MAKRSKQKGKKPKQEILMILVEGETDELAFEYPIEAFINKYASDVKIIYSRLSRDRDGNEVPGGDSTSDYGIYPGNFDEEISNRVMKDLTRFEGVYPKYIVKVIQIVDMDGAYIDDNKIVIKHTDDGMWADGVFYADDEIEVDHIESVAKRHRRKQTNLDYLCGKTSIKLHTTTVPYSVYFNSCNLEHFLWGDRNTPNNQKRGKAIEFSEKCQDDDSFFESVIYGEYALAGKDYKESWDYVQDRTTTNSLSRCSNLHLMLEDLKAWAIARAAESAEQVE